MDDKKQTTKYSVMMSVYAKETPQYLKMSIESMLGQTCPPDELVLVCDGRLGEGLERCVIRFEQLYPTVFKAVRLKENVGTGNAANAGIAACRNEIIVKMDSDDVALPFRCEKQLAYLKRHPETQLLGGFIEEFDSDTGAVIAVKKTPVTHEEILRYARRRNPINNQTLVFQKSFVMKNGGYKAMTRCEDYDFITRMLIAGARAANLPEVLVRYRVDAGNYERRRNFANTKAFIQVRRGLLKAGFSSLADFLIPSAAQIILFILPFKLTAGIYKKLLR
ncbi:MAG: glycosyltransferase [Oscillospiraceae bacterium]